MKYTYAIIAATILCSGVFFACKNETKSVKQDTEETTIAGNLTLQVDATVQPIVEDVLAVFKSVYPKAQILQVNRSESDIVNSMMRDSSSVVVLTRELEENEKAHFDKLNIKPRVTHFATDALALITNKTATDTVVNLEDVYKVLRGEEALTVKKLVFDNPNSSALQMLMKMAGVTKIPANAVYSLTSTADVLKYVNENTETIGVVGVNWLLQAPQELGQYVENLRVLGVDNVKKTKGSKKYFKPSQSNIATGDYPFTRKLYLLNYQGRPGLGMGFANYLNAPEGQRIILKSGLLPIEIPPREIEVRNEL
jgi:phosphate transport system substrate-binding protein